MPELLEVIKRTAKEVLDASKPVNITYGTVVGVSPLSVKLSDKLTLSKTALTSTAAITDDEGKLALAIGDKLILLRVQGGNRYVIVDRVVDV